MNWTPDALQRASAAALAVADQRRFSKVHDGPDYLVLRVKPSRAGSPAMREAAQTAWRAFAAGLRGRRLFLFERCGRLVEIQSPDGRIITVHEGPEAPPWKRRS